MFRVAAGWASSGLLALGLMPPGCAESFHAGLKIGVPITPYFDTGTFTETGLAADYSAAARRYTFGPSVEWRAANGFGLELNALYHRMGYVAIVRFLPGFQANSGRSAIDIKGNSWDFPLLLKYRLSWRRKPFVAAGPVLRHVGPVRGRGQQMTQDPIRGTVSTIELDTTRPSELRKRFFPGITAGAGIEFRLPHALLLPEFRYTRWTANISGLGGALRFAPNQAEFLVGARF